MKLFRSRRQRRAESTLAAGSTETSMGLSTSVATKADLELIRAEVRELRDIVDDLRQPHVEEVPSGSPPTGDFMLDIPLVEEVEDVTHADIEDPDIRFMRIIKSMVGEAPSSKVTGEMIDLTIIGRLSNDQLAWVNEDERAFGVIPNEVLNGIDLFQDDVIRGRVVSYPWGHIVQVLVPTKRSSPFNTRPASTALVHSAGVVPETAKGTFREQLLPGDVVMARIPYDGTGLPDKKNRIAKQRPSVFIRWESDYAILRPIYDVHGHVASNDLGMVLIDTKVLDKKSVVRNAEYDIAVNNIARVLGKVGTRDRAMLNIADVVAPAIPPNASVSLSPAAPLAPHVPPPTVQRGRVGKYQHLTSEEGALVESVRTRHHINSSDSCLHALFSELQANTIFRAALVTTGLPYAMIGQFTTRIMNELGQRPFTPLKTYLNPFLHSYVTGNEFEFASELDESNLPKLVLRRVESGKPRVAEVVNVAPPAPASSSGVAFGIPNRVQLDIPDGYLEPDLIILDQYSSSMIVGDSRLDLARALKDLRADGSAVGYVVGSGAGAGWQAFQDAAEHRGWKVERVNDRADTISVAVRLAQGAQAEVVTLVTCHADLVAEVENTGYEVNIVSTVVEETDDDTGEE